MFLPSLRGASKPHDKISVIFDIGSGSVGGALVKLSWHGKPKIYYSYRAPIGFQKEIDPSRFLDVMLQTLKHVAEILQKEGLTHLTFTEFKDRQIGSISIVLSSPWHASQTKIVTVKKDEPFLVSKSFIENVIRMEEKLFDQKYHKSHAAAKDASLQTIEKKVIQVKENGYVTQNPYGKKVKEAEIALFLGISEKDILSRIESAILGSFHSKDISFHSFLLSFYTIARDRTELPSFLIVDIKGEVTDVSLIKKDVLLETVSFPLGRNFLTRRACTELGVAPAACGSLISLYFSKKSDAATRKELTAVLEAAKHEWLQTFEKALAELGRDLYLPSDLYLTAEPELLEFFSEALGGDGYAHFTSEEAPFAVRVFDQREFKKELELGDGSDGAHEDSFLMIETLFANKLFQLAAAGQND